VSDDPTPEEAAAEEAARTQASAQNTAAELARMGIDPRALGLQAPEVHRGAPSARMPGEQTAAPPGPVPPGTVLAGTVSQPPADTDGNSNERAYPGNVVPLRPELSSDDLPRSGTSAAWQPGPPSLAPDSRYETKAPLQHILGRGLGRAPGREPVGAAPSQLARAITFGLMTPDAAVAADREREMVHRVRTRQTDQRVVVFLSGKGGVGTTSVAIGVGCVLAALREDSTTLVSLRAGTPSLGLALAGTPAPRARDVASAEPELPPLRLSNGLQLVDGSRWGRPVRRSDVPVLLDRLGQTSTFGLFDVGNDPSEAGQAVLARADQVVIVSGPGADGLDSAQVAAERTAEVDPYLLDTAVYVVVCQRESALRGVVRAMREALPGGARVVAVPPEGSLADGAAFDPSRVGPLTRLAMIDVAGLVALGSVKPPSGRRP